MTDTQCMYLYASPYRIAAVKPDARLTRYGAIKTTLFAMHFTHSICLGCEVGVVSFVLAPHTSSLKRYDMIVIVPSPTSTNVDWDVVHDYVLYILDLRPLLFGTVFDAWRTSSQTHTQKTHSLSFVNEAAAVNKLTNCFYDRWRLCLTRKTKRFAAAGTIIIGHPWLLSVLSAGNNEPPCSTLYYKCVLL